MHQAINAVKFKALARRLGLPMYRVVGVLESLWLFAQVQARDGDLSRFTPLELAGWIEWDGGDDAELIDALVETRWLDRDEGWLAIHDWDDHKPNYLKGSDAAAAKRKTPKDGSRVAPKDGSRVAPKDGSKTPPPNLTKPLGAAPHNQTEPNEADASASCPASPDVSESEKPPKASRRKAYAGEHPGFREWYAAYPRKEAPADASKCYSKAVSTIQGRDGPGGDDAVAYLLQRALAFAECCKGREDVQFIPHPSTWLNKGRYDDDTAAWRRGNASRIGAGQRFDPQTAGVSAASGDPADDGF
jgi:hypothetical protein